MRASSYTDIPRCAFLMRELDRRKPSIDCDKANRVLENIRHDFLGHHPELDGNAVTVGDQVKLSEVLEVLLPSSAKESAYYKHGALDVLLLSVEEYRDESFFQYPLNQVISQAFIPVTVERCRNHYTSDGKPVQRFSVTFSECPDGALEIGMKQNDTNEFEFSEKSDFRQVDIEKNYQVLSFIKDNAPLIKAVTISLDFESSKIPVTNPLMNVNRLTVYRSIPDLKQVTDNLVGTAVKPVRVFDYVILDSEDDNMQYIFLAMMEKYFTYLTYELQLSTELAITLIKDKFRLFEDTELARRLYTDSNKSFAKLPSPGRLHSYDTLGNSDSVMIRLLAIFRVVSAYRVPCFERNKFLKETLNKIRPNVHTIAQAGRDTNEMWSKRTARTLEVMLRAISDFTRTRIALSDLKKRRDKISKLEEFLRSSYYIQAQEYLVQTHPKLNWRSRISDLRDLRRKLIPGRYQEFNQKLEELLDEIARTLEYSSISSELDNSENLTHIKEKADDVDDWINDCINHYSDDGEKADQLNTISLRLSEHMMDLLAYTGKCD